MRGSTRQGKEPLTPKAQLSSTIKSARDIMRKDAGLNGDLDRIPQLAWLLFLKAFDGLERTPGGRRRQATGPRSRRPTAGGTGPPTPTPGRTGERAARVRQRRASAVPPRA